MRLHDLSGGNTERFQQLYSAACADAKCSAGFSARSDQHQYFQQIEALGQQDEADQEALHNEKFERTETWTGSYPPPNKYQVDAFPLYSAGDAAYDKQQAQLDDNAFTHADALNEAFDLNWSADKLRNTNENLHMLSGMGSDLYL